MKGTDGGPASGDKALTQLVWTLAKLRRDVAFGLIPKTTKDCEKRGHSANMSNAPSRRER